MTPLGEGIGVQMERVKKIPLIVAIAFVMGVIITIAEPDLQVLAQQVPSIPNKVLIYSVAVGVGAFLALAVVRILKRVSLSKLLVVLYGLLAAVSIFVPESFLAVAYDSGGVTTGPITVPFIMAMGVGMAAVRGDKNAASDSFGLVALSSIGPILAVLLLGCFFNPQNAAYTPTVVPEVATTKDVALTFAGGLPHYMAEVAMSILPIVAVFFIFQMMTHRYQKRQRRRVMVGFAYTYAGLVLFLCGVNVGFGPVGTVLGRSLAQPGYKWLLEPIGMLIGFIVKSGTGDSGAQSADSERDQRRDFRAGNEPMLVHRRIGQRRAGDAARGDRDSGRVYSAARLCAGAGAFLRCAADLCGHRVRLRRRGQRPDDHDVPAAAEHRRVRDAGRQRDDGCVRRGGAGGADPP